MCCQSDLQDYIRIRYSYPDTDTSYLIILFRRQISISGSQLRELSVINYEASACIRILLRPKNHIPTTPGRDASKAAAMALAPTNEVKAAELRRPLRKAVKCLVATTNASRDVLMDSATATARLNEEAIKVLVMTPSIAHSFLMDFIYFPSASKNAAPTLKRPHKVVIATTSQAVAQLREFVLKAYFKVLDFGYNPMPHSKAKKWAENDGFLTPYKGEKTVVAAAKNLFNKIGGSFRIVKDTSAGGRFHVDMTVGHYSLIESFVRNEF